MSGEEDDKPMYEDEQEELEQLRREMLEDEQRKSAIPRITFNDVKTCHESDEWETLSEQMRNLYVRLLRRCANSATFASVATQEAARTILTARGLPLESERTQKKQASEPLPPVVAEWVSRSRRKLVDRQKRLMLGRFNEISADGVISVCEPGPYQQQAIDELLEEGAVVLIRDDQVQLRTGVLPKDATKRRKRRYVMLGLPFDEERYRAELKQPPRPIPRQTSKGISYPHTPGLWPEETAPAPAPAPAPPAEDEDDLI